MQLKDGLREGDVTHLAALIEVKEKDIADVPKEVVELLKEFEDVMPTELPKTLSPKRAVDYKIELLLGSTPPTRVPYRMSPKELVELQKQLIELLEASFIQPSMVPLYCSRKIRMVLCECVDYKALNKVTVKNKYHVPLIQHLFDQLSKAAYFSKMDLRSGNWQVCIAEGDEPKATRVTR
jgi:hypothetical protein